MSSERIFDIETPTVEQASQTPHQNETTASLQESVHWFPHPLVNVMITPPIEPHLQFAVIRIFIAL